MSVYATREDEVDALLRREVFVDLHTVVRQALRAGVAEPVNRNETVGRRV